MTWQPSTSCQKERSLIVPLFAKLDTYHHYDINPISDIEIISL